MTWKDEIVSVMSKSRGQEMHLTDIYNQMKQSSLTTGRHLQPWKPGGQPRYQCWVRRGLTNLVNDGIIERVKQGVYLML